MFSTPILQRHWVFLVQAAAAREAAVKGALAQDQVAVGLAEDWVKERAEGLAGEWVKERAEGLVEEWVREALEGLQLPAGLASPNYVNCSGLTFLHFLRL
ncbi:hypothetical protein IFO70_17850 [Phormidium tenue FACHB-886]|nr:hypothetical protein [Phormidium tenue FACHB-886]